MSYCRYLGEEADSHLITVSFQGITVLRRPLVLLFSYFSSVVCVKFPTFICGSVYFKRCVLSAFLSEMIMTEVAIDKPDEFFLINLICWSFFFKQNNLIVKIKTFPRTFLFEWLARDSGCKGSQHSFIQGTASHCIVRGIVRWIK